ncbi:hypothetical protein B0H13DRAFT_1993721 [Mycena leptocephala]|nr:hypothetical protein B0H13DRAFT_1993721 [Mycena leptocephala]
MPLPSKTTVLIVGAGPWLSDLLIVDSIMAGENSSRAIVIQAATLEALDTVGCADSLVALGDKAERFGFLDGKSYQVSTDFSLLSAYTRFPFGLVIPQTNTEAFFWTNRKSWDVCSRPYKVVSNDQVDTRRLVDVHLNLGDRSDKSEDHQQIRNEAGIGFSDPDGTQDEDYGVLSQIAVSPDKEHTVYRIISGLRVEKTYWSSRFRTRSAIADRCFTRFGDHPDSGVVLLIGDAATFTRPSADKGCHSDQGCHHPWPGPHGACPRFIGPPLGACARLGVIRLTKRTMALFNNGSKPGILGADHAMGGRNLVRILTKFSFYRRMAAWRVSGLGDV